MNTTLWLLGVFDRQRMVGADGSSFSGREIESEIVEPLLSWLRAVSLLINVCCSRPCLWAKSDWNYPYPSLKACSTCMTILVTRNRRTCELTSYAESTCSSSDETHRHPREKRQRNTEKTRRNIASFDLSEVLSFTADYWRISTDGDRSVRGSALFNRHFSGEVSSCLCNGVDAFFVVLSVRLYQLHQTENYLVIFTKPCYFC